MLELHPFGNFIPHNTTFLLIGSFATKDSTWFYTNSRNQFWPLLEEVYSREFPTLASKKQLFKDLSMAVCDIILSCERKHNSNLDSNLVNITYNLQAIKYIIEKYPLQSVYFTSRYVEKLFKKNFKEYVWQPENLITLPSPSPRYAKLSFSEKAKLYKQLFPKLV